MTFLPSIKKISIASFGFIFSVFFLSSCQKDLLTDPGQTAESTKDLQVSPDFNWKTNRDIVLNISGLKDVNPAITNTLYVNSVNGVTYYKDRLTMASDYTIHVAVPASDTGLIIKFGSKIKPVHISSQAISFDYITQ